MRTCNECNEELPDDLFDYRGGSRKGLQATCKPCSLERLRKHRKKMRALVDEYKVATGCKVCGFNEHPFALHLDHRIRSEKRNRGKAGRALEVSWSEARIREELAKCDVLCANHHAIKTFESKDHLPE